MTIITRATLVALVALAVAASASAAQSMEAPVDPRIADGTARRDLDTARQRWRVAGLRSYRYEALRTCFCVPPPRYRRVVVRGGRSARATAPEVREVATVPRMFRVIRRAIERRVSRLDVAYAARGVPRRIFVDTSTFIADEEVGYSIRRFRRG